MNATTKQLGRWVGAGIALPAAGYAAMIAAARLGYGHPAVARAAEADPLLDGFMPQYDIVERHHIRVHAPAEITLAAAANGVNLDESPLIRAVFRLRELMLGSTPDRTARPRGLVSFVQSLGWRRLAERPGREIVFGAVTQPWQADVVFRPVDPDAFAAFRDPGFVKIAWTLRADPITARDSIFRTETRAVATDEHARTRFRRYWSLVSPGIVSIRWLLLRPLKREAERRARRESE
ncbi:MAG TPA: hypothetical protein VLV45_01965 [Gemmatimonadales bacterium]|nr:hypothetical protein [Gemmatimonadales bacterium]